MWIEGKAPFGNLGKLPAADVTQAMTAQAIWTIDTSALDASDLPARAERLRRLGQRGRPVDAGDLNRAADPKAELTEEAHAKLVHGANMDLAARAERVHKTLGLHQISFGNAARSCIKLANKLDNLIRRGQTLTLPDAAEQMRQAWMTLQDAMWSVSVYGLPHALRLTAPGDMLRDPKEAEAALSAIDTALSAKAKALTAAIAAFKAAPVTLADQRSAQSVLMAALRGATDGEAQPVFPLYAKTPETAPLLDQGRPIATALADFARVRRAVRGAAEALDPIASWQAFAVSRAATEADDTEDQFKPDEAEEPLAQHFGQWLTNGDLPNRGRAFAGLVVDDWTEQRPSRTQDAALAVNYDTPQSEAPNCLLLCVPPTTGIHTWTDENTATKVREAVA